MDIVKSVNDVPIRLTYEKWSHILYRHPEMADEKDKVIETLNSPEMIQEGDFSTLIAIKFYKNTPLTSKYLAVIYKESNKKDGFILTSYFTIKP